MSLKKTALAAFLFAVLPALAQNPKAPMEDKIVAIVGSQPVLKSELDQATQYLHNQYQAQNRSSNPNLLPQEALDLLINRKLQIDLVKRAKLNPNAAVIDKELLAMANAEGYPTLQAFAKFLESQQQGAYQNLRQGITEEIALNALWQNELENRANISQSEINAFLSSKEGQALGSDEYRTIHLRVPYLDDASRLSQSQKQSAQLIAERLKADLEQGVPLEQSIKNTKDSYPLAVQGADTGWHHKQTLPATLADVIDRLKVGQVVILPTNEGVDIVQLADKRSNAQMLVPEYKTRHLLIKVTPTQTEAYAQQKINALYQALQKGESFEELAATYSEDTASAINSGDLGWVLEGQMVPEFEQVMKNTTKGDYSTPFATPFGYHILKVEDIRQADVGERYRENLARKILTERLAPTLQEDWLKELRSATYVKILGQ